MTPSAAPCVPFFRHAYANVTEHGYADEVRWVETIRPLEDQDTTTFLREYVWVVLNAGMREQVARTIYDRFLETADPAVIRHAGKRAAVEQALQNHKTWFAELLAAEDRLAYLDGLPWIGPVTKHHLARNIGIDCVKPDRHLVRLAERFGYGSPEDLCRAIQREVGGRLGTIDLVLWRYCNLTGGPEQIDRPAENGGLLKKGGNNGA